jgi:lambda family phage portal protein
LYYNNDYSKDYYRKLKTNVIGHTGIILQAKAKDPGRGLDTAANLQIETAWATWGKRGNCDVTRQHSWLQIQNLVIETLARDGEVLIRKIRGFNNAFGFALQLLEADHLDETLNYILPGGGQIRMGIEYDEWDAPVAYWLLKKHPGDYLYGGAAVQRHERYPAADIIHIFDPWFIRQGRGMAWSHAVMSRMEKIDSFEEAAIIAAQIGASKMGFYTPQANEGQFEGDETTGEAETDKAEFFEEAEPGVFGIIPDGYQFQEYNPQYPHGEYDPFMDRQLKGAASGYGLNYCTFANDAAEVNFSSLRHFAIEDRNYYKTLQQLIIDQLCDPVFAEWLPLAFVSGQIVLPIAKLTKFSEHVVKPRTWDWVDPLKDVMARGKEVEFGFTTRKRVVEDAGGDWEEVCLDAKSEQEIEQKNGVVIGKVNATPPQEVINAA